MLGLTENDTRVVDYLVRNFSERNTINQLGRKLGLSPRGIHQLLRKLEKGGLLASERIGNGVFYKVNLEEEAGAKLAGFVLSGGGLNSYAKLQAQDLNTLKGVAACCILFGSVLKVGKDAGDVDVFLVVEKDEFRKVSDRLDKIRQLKPKKIHDVMMSRDDLAEKLAKGDEVISGILRSGVILWGSEVVVEAIKGGSSRKQA